MGVYLHTYDADPVLVAATCRRAGLEFMRGVREGWTADYLAAWLTGSYAQATSHAPHSECLALELLDYARDEDAPPSSRASEPQGLEMSLWTARSAVVSALEDVQSFRSRVAFARTAIRARDVAPAVDDSGAGLWIPLDRRGMTLRQRVLSLFAADFLIRPEDYVGQLLVCTLCESVIFDPGARRLGQCGAHRSSGFLEVLEEPDEDEDIARAHAADADLPNETSADQHQDRAFELVRRRR